MKKKTGRDTIFLLGWTLITVLSWVGFEVYRAYTKPHIPEVIQKLLAPLDPTLDTQVLDKLKGLR